MMNKPKGFLTAKSDANRPTVMRFFPPELAEALHPVGRLDKDTEGLLLMTDDGFFDRFILRPEQEVEKEYLFTAFGKLEPEDFLKMEKGVALGDSGAVSKPARAALLGYSTVGECEAQLPELRKKHYLKNPERPVTVGKLWIREGRKHQVKLMVSAVGGHVFALKRLSIAKLRLDETLAPGEYRALTQTELHEQLGYTETARTALALKRWHICRGVLFDLDGTLADTLTDLANAVNHALRENGFPERDRDEVRRFVGNGIRNLILRALPENAPEDAADTVFEAFRRYYSAHCTEYTSAYPGIPELLQALRGAGMPIGVVSNKAQPMTERICAKLFPGLFDVILGETPGLPRKPDPAMVRYAAAKLGLKPERIAYIGDSEVDVKTAANAGTGGLFVLWGFRSREQLRDAGAGDFAESPRELLDLLMK